MLIIVMSQSFDIDDYTKLIKIEQEHDEFFLQFLISLFVAHHSNQTSKASTSEIKNESLEKFSKLVNISDTKKSSQEFIYIVNISILSTDLNKDFITFKKSQNILSQNDTCEWLFFINSIFMKERFEHFESSIF